MHYISTACQSIKLKKLHCTNPWQHLDYYLQIDNLKNFRISVTMHFGMHKHAPGGCQQYPYRRPICGFHWQWWTRCENSQYLLFTGLTGLNAILLFNLNNWWVNICRPVSTSKSYMCQISPIIVSTHIILFALSLARQNSNSKLLLMKKEHLGVEFFFGYSNPQFIDDNSFHLKDKKAP